MWCYPQPFGDPHNSWKRCHLNNVFGPGQSERSRFSWLRRACPSGSGHALADSSALAQSWAALLGGRSLRPSLRPLVPVPFSSPSGKEGGGPRGPRRPPFWKANMDKLSGFWEDEIQDRQFLQSPRPRQRSSLETGAHLGVSPGSSVSRQGDLGEALTLATHFLLKTGARGVHHIPVLKDGHAV